MPKSPKNWPFPNKTILGLDRDMSVCDCSIPWSRLLNRHGRVIYPCKSCFNPAKMTRPCDMPV
ncbi:D-alanine--D-alanine ligase [Gossypium arboreum]|uniref:D-alanine--D-alanine ligase n=1 Tax=Gossypium arboreum TaxID=29729 RepID=A0A0B0PLJ0_GOSAR|nr:D-alanine--D-alanine ligase [Gossypium arboreum]